MAMFLGPRADRPRREFQQLLIFNSVRYPAALSLGASLFPAGSLRFGSFHGSDLVFAKKHETFPARSGVKELGFQLDEVFAALNHMPITAGQYNAEGNKRLLLLEFQNGVNDVGGTIARHTDLRYLDPPVHPSKNRNQRLRKCAYAL
jgi:hypothetical protein